MLVWARVRARKYGLDYNLSKEDITIPKVCPILGIPLVRGKGSLCDTSPTLDRINPDKGYIKGNVAVISYRANRMKQAGTPSDFRAIADWMESQLSLTEASA